MRVKREKFFDNSRELLVCEIVRDEAPFIGSMVDKNEILV